MTEPLHPSRERNWQTLSAGVMGAGVRPVPVEGRDMQPTVNREDVKCICDRDTLINDPGMTSPGCPVHDSRKE